MNRLPRIVFASLGLAVATHLIVLVIALITRGAAGLDFVFGGAMIPMLILWALIWSPIVWKYLR